MSHFLGIHFGRASLRARLLDEHGGSSGLWEKRYRGTSELSEALFALIEELSQHPNRPTLSSVVIGLDKGHRSTLPMSEIQNRLGSEVSLLTVPAPLAILLGALPSGPGLLLSFGTDLKLVALDSTHVYREFRMQEGGGQWWVGELTKLAQHSARLSRALTDHVSPARLMKALPQILELGDFPGPDPVLKARLDGLSLTIAESCVGLASRLPGVRRIVMSGFLHPSPLSQRVLEACEGALGQPEPQFPAEVGAALLGLALAKENQERIHLDKPLESGRLPATQWGASPVLVRRLYRLRRPFEQFQSEGIR